MKTCFSEEKLIKQFRPPPPFLRKYLRNFFMIPPPLCSNFKNKEPPLPPNTSWERKLCSLERYLTVRKIDQS